MTRFISLFLGFCTGAIQIGLCALSWGLAVLVWKIVLRGWCP